MPFDGSSEYWCEKLVFSISGYLEDAGYETEWRAVADKA